MALSPRSGDTNASSSPHGMKWTDVAQLIRLPHQTGTLLLLLPTLWALVLASNGHPAWDLVLIFVAGSFFMRSAGVIMNDLADRKFDRQVTRTRQRPLASGRMTPYHATILMIVLLVAAACLLPWLNGLTIALSPGALLLAALYPFSKRVLHIPQAILGLAFGWGTIMAWAAIRETLDTSAWLVYGATILWAIAYDTIYALQDRDDDLKIGVRSSALLFGEHVWIAVAICLSGMLLLLGLAGWLSGVGTVFYGVLALVGGFMSQQVLSVRHQISPAFALRLFQQHVWLGVLILLGIGLGFVRYST